MTLLVNCHLMPFGVFAVSGMMPKYDVAEIFRPNTEKKSVIRSSFVRRACRKWAMAHRIGSYGMPYICG